MKFILTTLIGITIFVNNIFSQPNINPINIGDKTGCHEKTLVTVLIDDSSNIYFINKYKSNNGQFQLDFNGSSGPIMFPISNSLFISKFNYKGQHIITKQLVAADAVSTYSAIEFSYNNGAIEFILKPGGYLTLLGANLNTLVGGPKYKPTNSSPYLIRVDKELNFKESFIFPESNFVSDVNRGYLDVNQLFSTAFKSNENVLFPIQHNSILGTTLLSVNDTSKLNIPSNTVMNCSGLALYSRSNLKVNRYVLDTINQYSHNISSIKDFRYSKIGNFYTTITDMGFQVRDTSLNIKFNIIWKFTNSEEKPELYATNDERDSFIYVHCAQTPNSVITKVDRNTKNGSYDSIHVYSQNVRRLLKLKVSKNGSVTEITYGPIIGVNSILNINNGIYTILKSDKSAIFKYSYEGNLIDSITLRGLDKISCINNGNKRVYFGTYKDTIDIDFSPAVSMKFPKTSWCNGLFVTSDEQDSRTFINEFETGFTPVSIFPNPFENTINIDPSIKLENIDVYVHDIQGRLITTKRNLNNSQINLSELERGVYLIRIGNYMTKIIKM